MSYDSWLYFISLRMLKWYVNKNIMWSDGSITHTLFSHFHSHYCKQMDTLWSLQVKLLIHSFFFTWNLVDIGIMNGTWCNFSKRTVHVDTFQVNTQHRQQLSWCRPCKNHKCDDWWIIRKLKSYVNKIMWTDDSITHTLFSSLAFFKKYSFFTIIFYQFYQCTYLCMCFSDCCNKMQWWCIANVCKMFITKEEMKIEKNTSLNGCSLSQVLHYHHHNYNYMIKWNLLNQVFSSMSFLF